MAPPVRDRFPLARPLVRSHRRPLTISLIGWGVFLLGLAHLWQAWGLSRQAAVLRDRGALLDPALLQVLALFWAAIFVGLALALWRRYRPVRRLLPLALLLYGLTGLTRLLVLASQSGVTSGWPLRGAALGLALGLTAWALNRPGADRYFRQPD